MNEVSCRAFGVILGGLEARGIDPEPILEGLPVSIGHMRDRRARVDWDVFAEILRRVGEVIGGPSALEKMGYEQVWTDSYANLRRVAAFFARPRDIYWLGTVWFGRHLFTIIEDEFSDLPNGRVREVLRIPTGYDPCPQLFHLLHGFLVAAPTLVGLGDAVVDSKVGPHEVVFEITPPASRFSLQRLWRRISFPLNPRPMIEQMSTQQEQLRQANRELKSTIDALRLSDERHRVFSELASDLRFIVHIDPGGRARLEWVHGAISELTGYSQEELDSDTMLSSLHRDDRDLVLAAVDQARDGGPARFECRLIAKDGTMRHAAASVRVTSDSGGSGFRVSGAIQDVTARRSAEDAHAQLATAVEQAGEGITVLDREARILYANPAFGGMMERDRESVDGRSIDDFAFGSSDVALLGEMRKALSSGSMYRGRYVTRRGDGSEFVRDATVAPVSDAGGELQGFVGVVRDVTREVQLENELLRAQRMDALGRLAGGLAHDFNNLLTVIAGYTDMLLVRLSDDTPSIEALEQVQDAADRGSQLIRRLLAFSRTQQLDAHPLVINELVHDVVSILERIIGENITVETDLQPDLGIVLIDRAYMEHVLMNLALNARDAMPQGGTLRFETTAVEVGPELARARGLEPGGFVSIAVRDTGIGMSEELQTRIFEPFFTTKEVGKGTGLGLSTAFGVVRQSGGVIAVESASGEGASFTIYLPAGAEARNAALNSLKADDDRDSTVLLVEADAAVRALARTALSEKGHSVLEAANPTEAEEIAALHPGRLDLLVIDMITPSMTGPDLYARLSTQRPGMRALYMSEYSELGDTARRSGSELGELLAKPFTPSELISRVRMALDPAAQSRELVGRDAAAPSVESPAADSE